MRSGRITVLGCVFLTAAWCCVQSAAQTTPNLIFATTLSPLLSGGSIGLCKNSSDVSCAGGVASASALVRELQGLGNDVFFLPLIDRSTPFVQMHPLAWGVNALVFDYFAVPVYSTPPSLFTAVSRIAYLQSPKSTARPLIGNVEVAPDSDWWGVNVRTYIYKRKYGFAFMESQWEANTIMGVGPAATAMRYLGLSGIKTRVLELRDSRYDPVAFTVQLQAALGNPAYFPTVVMLGTKAMNASLINGTYVVGVAEGTSTLTSVTIAYDQVTGDVVSVTPGSKSLTLTYAQRDAQFIADEVFLNNEALKATVNDPVVGTTSGDMPPGRSADAVYRFCLAGECPQGNLFTDAMRWQFNVDMAFTSSGGLRGPGWLAGGVKTSDIWGILPFANTACTAKMLGLTVFEMLNFTTSLANMGVAVVTPLGDRLLQMSGVRVYLNPDITYSRLISVEVWDATAAEYRPLDRFAYYTVAADSYVCNSFTPYPSYFNPRYAGEGPIVQKSDFVQTVVANYLQAKSPFNTSIEGRINNSTETDFLSWIQHPADCTGSLYWSSGLASCVECPVGYVGSGSSCIPAPKNNTSLIIAIAVPLGAILLAALLVVMVKNEIDRRKNVRNVANAPTAGDVTLLFTDIQDSTKLWSTVPASMSLALDLHHALIRECIVAHRGYEVKTVGDSFMIACGSVEAGVLIARDIQLKLQETQFPQAIAFVYAAENEEALDAIDDNPDELAPLDPIWNGLRVRVGIHVGRPDVTFDEVAKGYDYYGSPVNVAARVESVAKGGQVLCSAAVSAAVSNPSAIDVTFSSVGVAELKGVAEPMELFQIAPMALNARKFALLEKITSNGLYDMKGKDDTASSHGSSVSEATHGTGWHAVVDTFVERYKKFLTAMLRTAPKKEKDKLLESLVKIWRVQRKLSEEDYIEGITKRIVMTMRKELANETTEITMVQSMGGVPEMQGEDSGEQAQPAFNKVRRTSQVR